MHLLLPRALLPQRGWGAGQAANTESQGPGRFQPCMLLSSAHPLAELWATGCSSFQSAQPVLAVLAAECQAWCLVEGPGLGVNPRAGPAHTLVPDILCSLNRR